MSWEKLCDEKDSRGLGLKDIHQFNFAILAKQGWRLIMRAPYFLNTDFLNAKLGDNPSYMWRSIFLAQDIIKQGCRRCIGNEDSTFVWKVMWLPYLENGMLISNMPEELGHIKVQNLMRIGERKWDEEKLRDICNDRELISKIPLPKGNKTDSWYQIFDEK